MKSHHYEQKRVDLTRFLTRFIESPFDRIQPDFRLCHGDVLIAVPAMISTSVSATNSQSLQSTLTRLEPSLKQCGWSHLLSVPVQQLLSYSMQLDESSQRDPRERWTQLLAIKSRWRRRELTPIMLESLPGWDQLRRTWTDTPPLNGCLFTQADVDNLPKPIITAYEQIMLKLARIISDQGDVVYLKK